MPHMGFDLSAAARQEMIEAGFDTDFPPEVGEQLAALEVRSTARTCGVELAQEDGANWPRL